MPSTVILDYSMEVIMNNEIWLEYVKHCYDLVIESEGNAHLTLKHEVEVYVVHLMAKNFNRADIGENPIAIQILTALSENNSREKLIAAADECLLIQSFPLRRSKWPSETYYQSMGVTAYGLAGHIMERHFEAASKIMYGIFNRNLEKLLKFT